MNIWYTQNQYGTRSVGWIYIALKVMLLVAGTVLGFASVPVLIVLVTGRLVRRFLEIVGLL